MPPLTSAVIFGVERDSLACDWLLACADNVCVLISVMTQNRFDREGTSDVLFLKQQQSRLHS